MAATDTAAVCVAAQVTRAGLSAGAERAVSRAGYESSFSSCVSVTRAALSRLEARCEGGLAERLSVGARWPDLEEERELV